MAVASLSSPLSHLPFKFTRSMLWHWQPRPFSTTIRCAVSKAKEATRMATLKNNNDSLQICRVLNGLWQTSGGWGHIDHDAAVNAMLRYADAGLSTFDMSNHYGPAEDLYGIFINRVRRERPPELLEEVRGALPLIMLRKGIRYHNLVICDHKDPVIEDSCLRNLFGTGERPKKRRKKLFN